MNEKCCYKLLAWILFRKLIVIGSWYYTVSHIFLLFCKNEKTFSLLQLNSLRIVSLNNFYPAIKLNKHKPDAIPLMKV